MGYSQWIEIESNDVFNDQTYRQMSELLGKGVLVSQVDQNLQHKTRS